MQAITDVYALQTRYLVDSSVPGAVFLFEWYSHSGYDNMTSLKYGHPKLKQIAIVTT